MKKFRFLYSALFIAISFIISGYYTGVATTFGFDGTGAETACGNTSGCSITGSCHAHALHSIPISVSIELDSAGIPTTHYAGGMLYTVTLSGMNGTTDSLPEFGFQITSIAGDTSAPYPANAGTFTTPFPANTHYSAPQPTFFNLGLMEQNPPLPVTTGDGTFGSTYSVTFNWTAPPAGTGDVSFWGVLNAINGDGSYYGDNYNNCDLVINEWPLPLGINSGRMISDHDLTLFPNPASDHVQLNYEVQHSGIVSARIVDLTGKTVMEIMDGYVSAGKQNMDIPLTDLKKGIYIVDLFAEGKCSYKKLVVK